MSDTLDHTAFRRALERLEEALEVLAQDPENGLVRDATIQRFEFSYELSHRSLRRYLREMTPLGRAIEAFSFRELIHEGQKLGLVQGSFDRWHAFREARSRTSHAYDQVMAVAVLELVPEFFVQAQALLQAMEKRHADGNL